MKLTFIDWSIVAAYFLFNLAIGFYYKARAGQNIERVLPLRTQRSLVAGRHLHGRDHFRRGYAAGGHRHGGPERHRGQLAVVELRGQRDADGLLLLAAVAALRRDDRCRVCRDPLLPASRPPSCAVSARCISGFPINCIILGWVNLAMVKILMLILGVDKTEALLIVLGMIVLTSFISTLAGLWGVLVTDLFQFVIKMAMVIVLAVAAVQAVGGIDEHEAQLGRSMRREGLAGGAAGSVLSFVPDLNSAWMPMITFLVYISVNWWATWYPGAEPGGGGFVAQRMFCAKDERHSLLATLWFNIAHYAIRPWPWILVGLASIILYPNLEDPETGYVR